MKNNIRPVQGQKLDAEEEPPRKNETNQEDGRKTKKSYTKKLAPYSLLRLNLIRASCSCSSPNTVVDKFS